MSIVYNKNQLITECKNASMFEADLIISKLENELVNSEIPGIGLAANQIGINAKICIIRVDSDLNLINPKIIQKYDLMEFYKEGCLSFPDQWITTKRYNEIVVQDDYHPNGIICTGLEAVVVQHEVGHLYGEVMYDYEIKIPQVNELCWCNSGIKYKRCHMGRVIR